MSERSSSFPTLLLRSHRNRFGTRYVRDLSIFQLFYLIINETSTWNLFWLTAYDESHIFFFKLLDGLVFCRHLVWLNTYPVPEMVTRSIQTKNGPCFLKSKNIQTGGMFLFFHLSNSTRNFHTNLKEIQGTVLNGLKRGLVRWSVKRSDTMSLTYAGLLIQVDVSTHNVSISKG